MDAGHAKAALEGKEGAEKAIEDFNAGVNENPFGRYEVDGWRQSAYRRQMSFLIRKRDCKAAGHTPCCWEHDLHLLRAGHTYMGITSCPACEVRAEAERAKRNEESDV